MTAQRRLLAGTALLALMMTCTVGARSADAPPRAATPAPLRSIDVATMATWLQSLYSEAEFRALPADAVEIEARQCGCYDEPEAHYPYSVAVLTTPKGDLILRPDAHEMHVAFVRLAVRQGDLYCGPEPDAQCFGRFADVCDFTDFRYGPQLAPFFPTCKSATD